MRKFVINAAQRTSLHSTWLLLALLSAAPQLAAQPQAQPQTGATTAATAVATPVATPVATTPFGTPAPKTAAPAPKARPLSAAQYRGLLGLTLRKLQAMETHRPRPLGRVVGVLDARFLVRRADGQTQLVTGNQWSGLKWQLSNPNNVTRGEVRRARGIVQSQIRALDEWIQVPAFAPADAGKIVADLQKNGQIRVEALWWQKAFARGWKAVADAWVAFWKWFFNLLPKPRASPIRAAPSDKLLWVLFYIVIAAILAVVGWFVFRALGGSWTWRRRAVKSAAELEGEDAQLLLLPPDELRQRAENFAAQGQFREALRHRYLSLLLQLDARGVWRYDARRTNWEHIAALRRSDAKSGVQSGARGDLVVALSDLTRRFDRVRYGGAPCDEPGWNSFNQDAQHLEAQPAARTASAMEMAR